MIGPAPTVADIQALPDGFPVVDLKVRVEKVGKPFENQGQQGSWFRQSILVSDSTGQIEVSRSWDAKDGDPYRLEAGMMVLVSAKPSNKGGQLVGVQKTTFREKPQIRARAGFVTPIQGQTPSEGGSGVSGHPVASGGHSGGVPVSQVLTPGNPSLLAVGQPFSRGPSAKMTEEEACELLTRNYWRLVAHFGGRMEGKPSPTEVMAWSTSILIAVGRGDVVRDTPDHPAVERDPMTAERRALLERAVTQRTAEEIVLQKARAGGFDETEPGEDDPWTFGG